MATHSELIARLDQQLGSSSCDQSSDRVVAAPAAAPGSTTNGSISAVVGADDVVAPSASAGLHDVSGIAGSRGVVSALETSPLPYSANHPLRTPSSDVHAVCRGSALLFDGGSRTSADAGAYLASNRRSDGALFPVRDYTRHVSPTHARARDAAARASAVHSPRPSSSSMLYQRETHAATSYAASEVEELRSALLAATQALQQAQLDRRREERSVRELRAERDAMHRTMQDVRRGLEASDTSRDEREAHLTKALAAAEAERDEAQRAVVVADRRITKLRTDRKVIAQREAVLRQDARDERRRRRHLETVLDELRNELEWTQQHRVEMGRFTTNSAVATNGSRPRHPLRASSRVEQELSSDDGRSFSSLSPSRAQERRRPRGGGRNDARRDDRRDPSHRGARRVERFSDDDDHDDEERSTAPRHARSSAAVPDRQCNGRRSKDEEHRRSKPAAAADDTVTNNSGAIQRLDRLLRHYKTNAPPSYRGRVEGNDDDHHHHHQAPQLNPRGPGPTHGGLTIPSSPSARSEEAPVSDDFLRDSVTEDWARVSYSDAKARILRSRS